MSTVIAFDFGASTGRAIRGEFDGDKLTYREVHRFENKPIYENGTLYWDFPFILGEVKKVLEQNPDADACAFDTWGVDYGLLDVNGNLIGLPVNYRDERTNGMPQKVFEVISAKELYEKTGNQIMPINTLFQLCAETKKNAETLLFMPDLFAWALSGAKTVEKTIASTSQMMSMTTKNWDLDVVKKCKIDTNVLPEIVDSATVAGEYNSIKVLKVAGHDTQCAVAAMPAKSGEVPAFLSCGTWSLIGCECDEAVLTEKSMNDELSNELGANGKFNYLKNISGLWLIQEIRRNFRADGKEYSFNDMEQLARAEEGFVSFIDPDSPEFALPGAMPEKIREYCKRTGQPIPKSDGALVRCIYQSLAMKYKYAIDQIKENTGKNFDVLHLLGGGTKDGFLCQMTADSLGIPVIAGPTEATALGNIILQLIALGELKDVDDGRVKISCKEELKTYVPQSSEEWQNAYNSFLKATK